MRRTSLPGHALLGLVIATLLLPALAAGADQPGAADRAPKDLSRFGGHNRFSRNRLSTAADLQKMFEQRRADLLAVLELSGWGGRSEDLFQAVADGRFTESELPAGSVLQWIAMRPKKGKAQLDHNRRWAGKKPAPVFEIKLTSNDISYTFVVPKVCGNLCLIERTPIPAPVCQLTVTPASDCVTRTVTIDASASSVSSGRLQGVQVTVTGPDGKSEDLGAPSAGSLRWTRSWSQPGTYTFTATAASDTGRRSPSCTARLELRPCPPACVLSLSVDEVLEKEEFSLDASASKAEVGNVKTVWVEVRSDQGEVVSKMELSAPFRTAVKLDKAGTYTLQAIAEDEHGQRSGGACEATIRIIPRLGALTDWFAGKERRIRSAVFGGRCAPLIGARGGPTWLFSRNLELAATFGGLFNQRDRGNWSLIADVEMNYLGDKGFFGGGLGVLDFTHEDSRGADALIHAGVNLPWKAGRRPVSLFVEGRVILDELDDVANNYLIWAGLRLHHLN